MLNSGIFFIDWKFDITYKKIAVNINRIFEKYNHKELIFHYNQIIQNNCNNSYLNLSSQSSQLMLFSINLQISIVLLSIQSFHLQSNPI